ncbi:MAG: pectin esterase [Ruminococcaceae bacterium]|nr:pectin esterase [Oscillospiraceae bacterium]
MTELYAHPGDDLQALLDAAPTGATVHLAAGTYRQKLLLTTPGLTLLGAGADETILVWDDYAQKLHADGREYNTFRTWTLAVCADGVTMRGVSVVNDALHPETKGQEVALSVYGDRFLMEDCALVSTQDTLFLGPLPRDLIARYVDLLPPLLRVDRRLSQRFVNCRIAGTVDFIFGCGDAVFESCEIRSLVDARGSGYLAAPAHECEQTEGFVFRDCALTCEPGVAPGSIYLARPWRDYGLARFENCAVGAHIAKAGFDKWNDSERDKTARFYETPPVPGRVPWCNRA